MEQNELIHIVRLTATTGSAADNIGGQTLHSLLKLDWGKKQGKSKNSGQINPELQENMNDVNVLIIDEISMVGCKTLDIISSTTSQIKGINNEPFGGIGTVIFIGDFYQLPPYSKETPLYNRPPIHGTGTSGQSYSKSISGYNKFLGLTHVLFLTTQYRIVDPVYRDFVYRFRHGISTPEDQTYLTNKIITSETYKPPKDPLQDPIIIVKNNDLRCAINFVKSTELSLTTNRKMFYCLARDSCTNQTLTPRLRRQLLLEQDGSKTGYGAGILPLVIGMPVTFKNNIGTVLGICNGTVGRITNIVLDPRERSRVDFSNTLPHYLFFHPLAVHVDISKPGLHTKLIYLHICYMVY